MFNFFKLFSTKYEEDNKKLVKKSFNVGKTTVYLSYLDSNDNIYKTQTVFYGSISPFINGNFIINSGSDKFHNYIKNIYSNGFFYVENKVISCDKIKEITYESFDYFINDNNVSESAIAIEI